MEVGEVLSDDRTRGMEIKKDCNECIHSWQVKSGDYLWRSVYLTASLRASDSLSGNIGSRHDDGSTLKCHAPPSIVRKGKRKWKEKH